MSSATKIIRIACLVVAFVWLPLVTTPVSAAQQQSGLLFAKAPAEIILEEKTMEPAEIKVEKEAAERAEKAAADEKARRRYEKRKVKVEQLDLPEDTSPVLTVKQLQFSGNLLISTEKLLENMPVVYNASE